MESRCSRQQSHRAALAGRALSAEPRSAAPVPAELVLRFEPPAALRSAHLQSTLGSLPPVAWLARRRAATLLAGAEPLLIDCGEGVRLQGWYTAPQASPAPLAVLLHGWEASAHATSMLSLGTTLHRQGFGVLRLNLRDHGDTHALNREIFHSCRLPEVLGAVRAIAERFAPAPLYLAGFSLGGNFFLRVAAEADVPAAVRAVVAICPVLDPAATLRALEQGFALYRRWLVARWSRSLRRKQRAWPHVHDFRALVRLADLRAMTAALVQGHTSFSDLDAYLQGYAITGTRLESLRVPTDILLAEDDPLVPIADAGRLARVPVLRVWRSRYGGHCGFLQGCSGPSAADLFVSQRFALHRSGA